MPNHDDAAAPADPRHVQAALSAPEEALARCDRALALKPDDAEALNDRGVALIALKRPEEALASFDRALALTADHAEALNNRGVALLDLKRPEEALASYDRALALAPDYAEGLNNRGNALKDLGRPAEALTSYDRALAVAPDYVEALNNRGNALKDLGRPAEALTNYERALAIRPDYVLALENKGILLTELGRFDEASESMEQAITLEPRRVQSYYNLTESKRLAVGDPYIRAMRDLARDMASLSTDEQIQLNFALAKAFADIGDHAASFQRLLDGNTLKRTQTDYDEAAILGAFEGMPAAFTADMMRAGQGLGDPSTLPVFIVGMPRSGTTLIEQILASHPKVFGVGETEYFANAIAELGVEAEEEPQSPEDETPAAARQMRRLGEIYVNQVKAAAPPAERIADKTLENFRVIGLIRLALPNARIIHARRDPVDTCLSCFSKLFINLPYTYDLAELGRHYRAYEALMAHWRAVVPQEVMIDVQYEEVVADLEGQARRIVAHCGLDWDPRCLDFHLTERSVGTASRTQVRQPIYKSSVGRWRAYEPYLGPLLAELGPSVPS
jgi:Tfp pilus assembly protein PilF